MLKFSRVHGLLLEVGLVYLIVHMVDVSLFDLRTGLLEVELLGFVLVLEVDIGLDEAVSSGGRETSYLRDMGGGI